jgi:hypothetical protein
MHAPTGPGRALSRAPALAGGDFLVRGRHVAGALASGSLFAAAALVVLRRGAGALGVPLAPPEAVAAAAGLFVMALAARFLANGGLRLRTTAAGHAAVSIAVVAAAGALSIPGAEQASLAALWITVVAEEAIGWGIFLRRGRDGAGGCQVGQTGLPRRSQRQARSARTVQRLVRTVAADATEEIDGRLVARIAPGQRTEYLHVAFCPPLARTPELTWEQVEGPPARIKPGQVLAFGARLDIKLDEPAEEALDVAVEFRAVCRSDASAGSA